MFTSNEDVLDLIQKYLNSEQDLSSLLQEVAEGGVDNLANMITGNSRIKKVCICMDNILLKWTKLTIFSWLKFTTLRQRIQS